MVQVRFYCKYETIGTHNEDTGNLYMTALLDFGINMTGETKSHKRAIGVN